MHVYGYVRVSTVEQNMDLQKAALSAAGCGTIVEESASAAAGSDRPKLDALIAKLQPGDTLIVWKLDRLSRSLLSMLVLVQKLTDSGVTFRSLTEGFDTATPAGKMMLRMVATFAEYEREMILQRTKAGMAAARSRGVKVGRPHALSGERRRQMVTMLHTHGNKELATMFGVSVASVRRTRIAETGSNDFWKVQQDA